MREIKEIIVFSPAAEHRNRFADRARHELGINAETVGDARSSVEDVDVVVLATRAETPVIDADWVRQGTHFSTIGPKTRSRHETPPELAERAAVVVIDSRAQAEAYGDAFFTNQRLDHLGSYVAGDRQFQRSGNEITLYCSTGLAGSEVVIADALVRSAARESPSKRHARLPTRQTSLSSELARS